MVRKLFLAGTLAAGLLLAQRGGGSGMGGAGMGNIPMRRAPRATRADQIAEKLKLNSKQKDQLSVILATAREQAGPVREEMDNQRADIASAIIDAKPPEELQKLLDHYAEIAGRMTALEGDAFAKICDMLKPEQQSRAPQAFELMAGMFDSERAR
jgi:regulator of protease activity HflC (stomatin/prohibitin superfamily)